MHYIYFYKTDIGKIGIVGSDAAITNLYLPGENIPHDLSKEETPILYTANQQLQKYFQGIIKNFDLPLHMTGTDFMMKVWRSLLTIPYGETRSYGDIAKSIGNKKACRAVGMANHRNPISIIVPCHRVIGSDGKLVGYGGGLKIKSYLLELERYHANRNGG
jgi:methylated-DNA-[protein]-cysteine S-methyltransferase